MTTAGYSGTPLLRELGVAEGSRLVRRRLVRAFGLQQGLVDVMDGTSSGLALVTRAADRK